MKSALFDDLHALVFDLDGTLIDAFEDLAAAVNHARAHFNKQPLSVEQVTRGVGNGVKMLTRRTVLDAADDDDIDETLFAKALPLVQEYYRAHNGDRARLYPGVREGLPRLRAAGLRLSVLTNKPEELSLPLLKRLGIDKEFDCIVGGMAAFPHKPEPDGMRHIMRTLDVQPKQTLMIGDGPADVGVVCNAGTLFCAVTWGAWPFSALQGLGAEYCAHTFEDLLTLCNVP